MGMVSIGAKIVMNVRDAISGAAKFRQSLTQTSLSMGLVKAEAAKSNVTVNQMLNLMKERRAPTQFQTNVKLTSQTIRSFTGLVKEARITLTSLFGTAHKGIRVGGISQATHHMRKFGQVITQVKSEFGSAIHTMLLGLESLGGGGVLDGVGSFFKHALTLAGTDEGDRVTFDTLLGNKAKSDELYKRVETYSAKTPFEQSDIVAGSKLLLNLSKDNVDENEKLFKLAGQIAALKPGTSVSDTARGMFGASMGEFEILKSTFGLRLNAKMFQKSGAVGGKQYIDAVMKEIQKQLDEKTGGRDLVAALGETLFGKMSTLTDVVDMTAKTFGQAFVKGFDIKGMVDKVLPLLEGFRVAINTFLMGETGNDLNQINGTVLNLAFWISELVKQFVNLKDKAVSLAAPLVKAFDSLGVDQQRMIFNVVAGVLALSSGFGVLTPIISLFAIVAGGIGTFILPLIGGVTSVLSGAALPAIGAVVIAGGALVAVVGAIGLAFMLFKRKNESVTDALFRLGGVVFGVMSHIYDVMMAIWEPIGQKLGIWMPIVIERLSDAFDRMRKPFAQLFGILFGQSIDSMSQWAVLGAKIADILVEGLVFGAELAAHAMEALGYFIMQNSVFFYDLISDFANVGRAIINLVTGTGSAMVNLRTFFKGFADIITWPFRLAIVEILKIMEDAMTALMITVAPFSSILVKTIGISRSQLIAQEHLVSEGFLGTNDRLNGGGPLDLGGDTISALAPDKDKEIIVNLDGRKVGEGLQTADGKAKNTHDPLSPEEMGFALDGNNRIRTVGINEVAGRN